MSNTPTLVFVPGSWHMPSCYDKVIKLLQDEHGIKCACVTLPSMLDNPNATFKDDLDAARSVILSETTQGRDVIVIAHSYGGMIGNSAIKGLSRPKNLNTTSPSLASTQTDSQNPPSGHVTALVLIASGFIITGLAFMDPLLGIPPPSWRVDKETGYATLVANPREFFYHDLPDDEAEYWVSQLKTQSLKALFEGGEHAYAGWQDVPSWYIGTAEDRGLPVMVQRMSVSMARVQNSQIYHTELKSSHSPFLSMPNEVVETILEAVKTVSGNGEQTPGMASPVNEKIGVNKNPTVRLGAPITWFTFGIPFLVGRALGWGYVGFLGLRRLWRRK